MTVPAPDVWVPAIEQWVKGLSDPPVYALPTAQTLWEDAALYVLRALDRNNLVIYGDVRWETLVAFAERSGVPEGELDALPDTEGWTPVAAGTHSAPMKADPAAMGVLQDLGLVAGGAWTPAALPVLWRLWANMTPGDEPERSELFEARLEQTCRTIPSDIAADIERLVMFAEEDLEKVARSVMALTGRAEDADVRRRLADRTALQLESIFEDRWRFTRGWLPDRDLHRTLFSGFDGLASRMSDALIHRLYPTSDMAKWRPLCICPKPLH